MDHNNSQPTESERESAGTDSPSSIQQESNAPKDTPIANGVNSHPLTLEDFAETARYLKRLDPTAKSWVFQTFDDSPQRRPELARVIVGTLNEAWPELQRFQSLGAGIFVTVNYTEGGRKKKNFCRARAIWQEDDTGIAPTLPLEPQMEVESSPGKKHGYLLTDTDAASEWDAVQARMVVDYGSDPNAKDRTRVLRLPGTWHLKNPAKPFKVRIVRMTDRAPYSWDEIKAAIPPLHSTTNAKSDATHANGPTEHHADAELIRQVQTGENYHGPLLTLTARYASRSMKPEDIIKTIQGLMMAVDDRSERWKARYGEISRLVFSAVKKFTPVAITYQDIVNRIEGGDLLDTDVRDTVKVAIAMLAEASLSASDADSILKLLKDRSGASIGALRRDLRSARAKFGDSGSGQDHLAIARSARRRMGSDTVIFAQQAFWRWSDSGVWSEVDDRDVKQVIQQTIETDFSNHHVTRSAVDSVADVLKTECYIEGQQFDVIGRDGINVKNGTLFWIVGKWELHPHRQENFRTTQLPVEYDSNALAPRFAQFLQEVFRGDPDAEAKEAVLLEAVGYSLLPSCKFERFILLIGGGANGKSVVLDTVSGLVGFKYVSAVQPSQFGNRFQRAHLQGKLANIITEMAEGAEIADAELKSIVSGELTTAEHKMRPPFDFHPFATCWFATNHMPHTRDFSEALFRRAIVLKFNNRFDGPECDPHLKEKLRAELPGILNLALAGLARLLERNKFTEVASNEAAKRDWRIQADQVARFVEECCTLDRTSIVPSGALYSSYHGWALGEGIGKRVNRKTFTQRLERLGVTPTKGTAGVRLLVGIRPNAVEDGHDLV